MRRPKGRTRTGLRTSSKRGDATSHLKKKLTWGSQAPPDPSPTQAGSPPMPAAMAAPAPMVMRSSTMLPSCSTKWLQIFSTAITTHQGVGRYQIDSFPNPFLVIALQLTTAQGISIFPFDLFDFILHLDWKQGKTIKISSFFPLLKWTYIYIYMQTSNDDHLFVTIVNWLHTIAIYIWHPFIRPSFTKLWWLDHYILLSTKQCIADWIK